MIARRLFFEGQVQGVGFRAKTARIAAQHAVAGFVKNLRDGRVELLAEGEAAAVEAFVNDVRRKLAVYIVRAVEAEVEPGNIQGFRIAYD